MTGDQWMQRTSRWTAVAWAAAVIVVACSSVPSPSSATLAVAADSVAGRAAVARLESEVRALAVSRGCNAAPECRVAPVGARACGGPRTYVAYCAANTDSLALFAKLSELKAIESQLNRRAGVMGSCEVPMPPEVHVQGGHCVAP